MPVTRSFTYAIMIATTTTAKVIAMRATTTMRNTVGTKMGTTKGPARVVTGGGVVMVEGVVAAGGVAASATACIYIGKERKTEQNLIGGTLYMWSPCSKLTQCTNYCH